MKKVNILLCILYVNNILLGIFSLGFILREKSNIHDIVISFGESFSIIFGIWLITFLATTLLNVISLIGDAKKNNTRLLYRKMKRIKFGLIPYWIINFICYLPIGFVSLSMPFGVFILLPLFMLASYVVLIITSTFSITFLRKLYKNNVITIQQFILHTILQLMFIIDIIDVIYIIRKLILPLSETRDLEAVKEVVLKK